MYKVCCMIVMCCVPGGLLDVLQYLTMFLLLTCSVTEVLTNRDLLQRIVRLGVGSGTQSDAAVPFKPGQNSDWSSFLLVDSFWKACLLSRFRPAHG